MPHRPPPTLPTQTGLFRGLPGREAAKESKQKVKTTSEAMYHRFNRNGTTEAKTLGNLSRIDDLSNAPSTSCLGKYNNNNNSPRETRS